MMKIFLGLVLYVAFLVAFVAAMAALMRLFVRLFVRLAEAPLREVERECEARSRSFLAFLAKVRFYALSR